MCELASDLRAKELLGIITFVFDLCHIKHIAKIQWIYTVWSSYPRPLFLLLLSASRPSLHSYSLSHTAVHMQPLLAVVHCHARYSVHCLELHYTKSSPWQLHNQARVFQSSKCIDLFSIDILQYTTGFITHTWLVLPLVNVGICCSLSRWSVQAEKMRTSTEWLKYNMGNIILYTEVQYYIHWVL